MTQMRHSVYDEADLLAWRESLERSLRREDGWLALAGLFWLQAGENTVGSDPNTTVTLPSSVPAALGTLKLTGTSASFRAEADAAEVTISIDDLPYDPAAGWVPLVNDAAESGPTLIKVGTVTFFVIKRGDQFGVRVRDSANPARATFTGRHWFAPNPAYLVQGRFTPHTPARTLPVVNIVGITEPTPNPGEVTFTLNGTEQRLQAFEGAAGKLFFVFRDATAGKSTYGAARFLTAPYDEGAEVTLDFNRAYNPPCAFTPYATCPLPPRENILSIAVEAGERYQANHAGET